MEKNKSFVYILHCADDTLYTGYTTNLVRRLKEHQAGSKKCKYTMAASRRPVSMSASWAVMGSRGDALRIEAFIKKQTRGKKKEIIGSPELLEAWYAQESGTTIPCLVVAGDEAQAAGSNVVSDGVK